MPDYMKPPRQLQKEGSRKQDHGDSKHKWLGMNSTLHIHAPVFGERVRALTMLTRPLMNVEARLQHQSCSVTTSPLFTTYHFQSL